jgi:hypothetical protein
LRTCGMDSLVYSSSSSLPFPFSTSCVTLKWTSKTAIWKDTSVLTTQCL